MSPVVRLLLKHVLYYLFVVRQPWREGLIVRVHAMVTVKILLSSYVILRLFHPELPRSSGFIN